MYIDVERSLASGEVIILDGGTGTDIQKRGAVMDNEVWCALANLTHPEIVREVHAEYIRAGADIITANTFATSPLLFSHFGRADEIEAIDRAAIKLARQAVDEAATKPVAIAGSFSVMQAVEPGTDRHIPKRWKPADVIPLFEKKAGVLAAAGCDFILMEMMRDIEVSLWATEAAVATGLPVWVGMSAERGKDHRLTGFGNSGWQLSDIASMLMSTGASVGLIMHNDMAITADALEVIKSVWAGPIGAYPEAGHFEMPDWKFTDISPQDFVTECRRWRRSGATVLGGCCGIGPEHIKALAQAFKKK